MQILKTLPKWDFALSQNMKSNEHGFTSVLVWCWNWDFFLIFWLVHSAVKFTLRYSCILLLVVTLLQGSTVLDTVKSACTVLGFVCNVVIVYLEWSLSVVVTFRYFGCRLMHTLKFERWPHYFVNVPRPRVHILIRDVWKTANLFGFGFEITEPSKNLISAQMVFRQKLRAIQNSN